MAYLGKHCHRFVNDSYYQAEGISIGSGEVGSLVKQIGRRVKISGAQWNADNVQQVLLQRCAYLNSQVLTLESAKLGCTPTVRPSSVILKCKPFFIAAGATRVTIMRTMSPGNTAISPTLIFLNRHYENFLVIPHRHYSVQNHQ